MKKALFISLLSVLLVLPAHSQSRTARGQFYTGTGGRGIVIAVPSPLTSGIDQADNWMPQLFQDLITSDLARYSAMTVIDRHNEDLVLAEQQRSTSPNYSEEDFISMTKMTNAKFIVAGNIRGQSGRYMVTFRINNIETNEIQAAFTKQYAVEDIESGLAAKEAVVELLEGMGIELTAAGRQSLLTIQPVEVQSTVQLAKGIEAEKNNNEIEALGYYYQAININSGMKEATQRIQSFGQGSPGASIREHAEWATSQKTRWEKIFNDLATYVDQNLLIAVYDFSTITDQFDARTNKVTLTVTPGVKIIPDSKVLTVWKTVVDEWHRIRNLEENKSWARSLSNRNGNFGGASGIRSYIGYNGHTYLSTVELYDAEGIRIARSSGSTNFNLHMQYRNDTQILPQNRYFNNTPFKEIKLSNINISAITNNLSVKVVNIGRFSSGGSVIILPGRIMSVAEWEDWLKAQGNTR